MNPFRKALVAAAFNKLDRDGSGLIQIDDIMEAYHAEGHPNVRHQKKTMDYILDEFYETLEYHNSIYDGRVYRLVYPY